MADWHDLPADERAAWTEQAERETGMDFHDLPADERASWTERAEDPRGWYGSEVDY